MFPKFTLNARIIFLLMVMFAFVITACTKKTNNYVLILKTHNDRALHINAGGRVTAADITFAQAFTIDSVGDFLSGTFKITLFAKEVGRYLCFRRGKLVGLKNSNRDCHFIESLDHGYFMYANAYDVTLRVGFTKSFKPVGPRHRHRLHALRKAYFRFEKAEAEHFQRISTTTTTTPHHPSTSKNNSSSSSTTTTTITTTTRRPPVTVRRLLPPDEVATSINNINNSTSNNDNTNNNYNNDIGNGNGSGSGSNKRMADLGEGYTRQRKRKQQLQKLRPIKPTQLQPKNLARHHHNNSTFIERRREHQREQLLRKHSRRLHRRRGEHHPNPDPVSTTSSSSSAAVTASALTATASLAPSALNIVAMLAAGRRKRGRRKKDNDPIDVGVGVTDMDMQIVAQTAPSSQRIDQRNAHQAFRHRHDKYAQVSQQQQRQQFEYSDSFEMKDQNGYVNTPLSASHFERIGALTLPKQYMYIHADHNEHKEPKDKLSVTEEDSNSSSNIDRHSVGPKPSEYGAHRPTDCSSIRKQFELSHNRLSRRSRSSFSVSSSPSAGSSIGVGSGQTNAIARCGGRAAESAVVNSHNTSTSSSSQDASAANALRTAADANDNNVKKNFLSLYLSNYQNRIDNNNNNNENQNGHRLEPTQSALNDNQPVGPSSVNDHRNHVNQLLSQNPLFRQLTHGVEQANKYKPSVVQYRYVVYLWRRRVASAQLLILTINH